jgi:hypothetical protein
MPTPSPTPVPTPTPVPQPTRAELLAACSKGTPIPEAAKYAGTVHALVVVYSGDTAWILDNDVYDINAKWYSDDWPGPIQLVVCDGLAQEVKVGSCGTYTRTSDGALGEIVRYRNFEVVRVVVAKTGKTLQSKTFSGNTPTCATSIYDVDNRDSNPPWKISGTYADNDGINAYAKAVSTQKVK